MSVDGVSELLVALVVPGPRGISLVNKLSYLLCHHA
jgi:hypothetical protein